MELKAAGYDIYPSLSSLIIIVTRRVFREHHNKFSTDINVDHLFYWDEVGECKIMKQEIIQDMCEKISIIQKKLAFAQQRQNIYTN